MFALIKQPLRNHPSLYISRRLALLTVGLFLCAILISPQAFASEQTDSGTNQLVTGAACFIVTPVYGAFKLVYAGAGAMAGGLAWVFTGGDKRAAQKIWDASMKGTYIITPDHLKGRKQINFIGPTGR